MMGNIHDLLEWIKIWLTELVKMFDHIKDWMEATFPKADKDESSTAA